jgi:hypothetical protein
MNNESDEPISSDGDSHVATCPDPSGGEGRRDDWTPFCRHLFLEVARRNRPRHSGVRICPSQQAIGLCPQTPRPAVRRQDEEPESIDLSDRYWKDDVDEIWITDFPPPPDFGGWQSGPYGEGDYQRACTPQEIAIIEADAAADRAEDEELRDAWFAMLRGERDDPTNRHAELGSASIAERGGAGGEMDPESSSG